MTEVTNWNRFKEQQTLVVKKKRNYKPFIALVALILGTLLLSVGMLHFGVFALLITLGAILFIVGLALSF